MRSLVHEMIAADEGLCAHVVIMVLRKKQTLPLPPVMLRTLHQRGTCRRVNFQPSSSWEQIHLIVISHLKNLGALET